MNDGWLLDRVSGAILQSVRPSVRVSACLPVSWRVVLEEIALDVFVCMCMVYGVGGVYGKGQEGLDDGIRRAWVIWTCGRLLAEGCLSC